MIKLIDLLLEDKIKASSKHYQQVLDQSNGLSSTNKKFIQSVIDSVKKQGDMATPKQLEILKRLKAGTK